MSLRSRLSDVANEEDTPFLFYDMSIGDAKPAKTGLAAKGYLHNAASLRFPAASGII